jgi:hypothetical protein
MFVISANDREPVSGYNLAVEIKGALRMKNPCFARWIAIPVLLVFCFGFLPGPAGASEVEEPGWTEAANKGPILWYVRDPEKKKAMEEDMELWRLFNEANKGKKRRRAIGAGLFYPGATIMGLGILGGLFQSAIGVWDENAGETALVVGVTAGAALMAPGIYFRSAKSKAEKRYENYIRETYEIIPIVRDTPDGNRSYGLAFKMQF